jgi:uncharacterized membrane protein YgaE (UPF0421/DUF939 family)
MAVACLITYWIVVLLLPHVAGRPAAPVSVIWAVISAVFVYKNTRNLSLAAGLSRLFATLASVVICLAYLSFLPATPLAMAILIAIGTVLLASLGRSDEIGPAAITTAVVMIVAADDPRSAWEQPLLRLADTVVGIVIGIVCKWIASSAFYKLSGQKVD